MKKMFRIFIAINLLGIGINFVLQAGFGCDAITMLNDGITRFLHTNYTLSGIIYHTVLLSIALIFARKLLGWGSVWYAYGTGVLIDLYQVIPRPLEITSASWQLQIIVLLIGQLLLCFAFAMLIEMDLGRSSLDAILAKLVEKLHVSYRVMKTICDVIFVVVALLLGATFGVGTIFCILSSGYGIDFFCKFLRKRMQKNNNESSCLI